MKSQKDAVVEEVVAILGSRFVLGKDCALSLLSPSELELIKGNIAYGIRNGRISYGKSNPSAQEVVSYARSMVMNHLKKAKELNGSQVAVNVTTNVSQRTPSKKSTPNKIKLPKGIKAEILSPELIEFASKLVK